ncbi:MAG: MBL fold metallo-hydrolase [Actinomycetota bacterium]|nr:MBL fold metallo-hydrolase [Actinomycetota bacterium]
MSAVGGAPEAVRLPAWATLALAPNPGPMTLDGTNTWVVRAPGASSCVVVDPGPLHQAHLERVAAYGPVELVLLTHRHPDHAEGAGRFAEMTGAPVAAADPSLVRGAQPLWDGQVLDGHGGVRVRVLATPGHTSDSVSFVVEDDEPGVLTGDTVLGRGTTVVAHPDGVLGDYLRSLDLLRGLGPARVLPGHGPLRASAVVAAEAYLEHRRARLEQVRAALAAGARTASDVVQLVYADVDRAVWPAAEQSVRAQLAYLRGE